MDSRDYRTLRASFTVDQQYTVMIRDVLDAAKMAGNIAVPILFYATGFGSEASVLALALNPVDLDPPHKKMMTAQESDSAEVKTLKSELRKSYTSRVRSAFAAAAFMGAAFVGGIYAIADAEPGQDIPPYIPVTISAMGAVAGIRARHYSHKANVCRTALEGMSPAAGPS